MEAFSCACIIPFHNEAARILSVVAAAIRTRSLAQLICVDDGSTDYGADLVSRSFPEVRLLRLPERRGKTAAIQIGLEHVSARYTLLLDADLRDLRPGEIRDAQRTIECNPDIDMIILRRSNAAINSKISRGDVLFSGERILRSGDLRAALQPTPTGYQLEIAINQYMLRERKAVYWMPSSALNTYKVDKTGIVPGLRQEVRMLKEMLHYDGFGIYVQQFLFFARQQAPRAAIAPIA